MPPFTRRFAAPLAGAGLLAAALVAPRLMPSGRAPAQAATAETLAASAQASDEVHIDNFAYSPAVLTIPAGTKVTWINRDDVPHTVTAADRQFNSGALDTDGQYSRVFSQAGTYSYFCALHPHMKGKIIVR